MLEQYSHKPRYTYAQQSFSLTGARPSSSLLDLDIIAKFTKAWDFNFLPSCRHFLSMHWNSFHPGWHRLGLGFFDEASLPNLYQLWLVVLLTRSSIFRKLEKCLGPFSRLPVVAVSLYQFLIYGTCRRILVSSTGRFHYVRHPLLWLHWTCGCFSYV